MHNSINDTLSGNVSGGKPMVMLQNDGVLPMEGDSNSQDIQDSNSKVILDKNFGGVLIGKGFYSETCLNRYLSNPITWLFR